MDIIKVPIGYLLDWIYGFVNNYGVALILFTLAVKLILLPLTLKQQKSMTKMQKLQPKLQVLQEKYKNDQQMLSQETMKLYKEYGASPMGGCLPLLIQLPILISLYRVIYEPLKYMCHYGADKIAALAKAADVTIKGNAMAQIDIAQKVGEINFDFFGLNLAQKPELSFAAWATLLIPVLAAVTTYLSSKITQWMNKNDNDKKKDEPKKPQRVLSTEPKKNEQNGAPSAEGMTKSMSVVMPIFTLWITYTLPMAMGIYWIASNVFGILQTVFLNNFYANKFSEEIELHDSEKKSKQSENPPQQKEKEKQMMIIEKSAKTKEEAIALALEELGVEEDMAEIEVVDEGSKGFLGFGSKMAVVKVSKKTSEKKAGKAKECCPDDSADKAKEFLSKIFELTGEDVTVDTEADGDVLKVNLSGPDMGIVIGKRGETLDALQHLTSLAVNKGDAGFMKISLDAENYREKRNEALESLAGKLANKVMRTRRSTTLEPMNAYERRIIHSALQDHEFVTTYSIGQGINRKVVIALKQK